MLDTDLKHLATEEEAKTLIKKSPYVMICCGRMGPMCIPVYEIMHQLEPLYPYVEFRDVDFDTREAQFIRNLPECRSFMGLPFTIYFKNGNIVRATSGIQTEDEISAILNEEFGGITKKTKSTFSSTEIEKGYHPSGYRIDKTASPMDFYTKWKIDDGGKWRDPEPVCFDSMPAEGWYK